MGMGVIEYVQCEIANKVNIVSIFFNNDTSAGYPIKENYAKTPLVVSFIVVMEWSTNVQGWLRSPPDPL